MLWGGGVSLSILLPPPELTAVFVLTLGVILVNGWTDAPNAIATAVAGGVLPFSAAATLAAVCNLLGAVLSDALFPAVTRSVLALLPVGGDQRAALCGLCAALAAIIIWSTAAWLLGIPTSESHGLLAGLAGAALALEGNGLPWAAWGRVLLALPLSVMLGFLPARWLARRPEHPRPLRFYRRAQCLGAAAMALLHGAQDGQKFLGVLLLGTSLAAGQASPTDRAPLWLSALCAGAMALGTALGGRRIIDTVGRDMVELDPRRGLAADLVAGGALLLCTLLGLPVSTTHTKTAAILGAGRYPDWSVAQSIALAWVLTFPICGLLGCLCAKFLFLFL